jgi:hypothetical protein
VVFKNVQQFIGRISIEIPVQPKVEVVGLLVQSDFEIRCHDKPPFRKADEIDAIIMTPFLKTANDLSTR